MISCRLALQETVMRIGSFWPWNIIIATDRLPNPRVYSTIDLSRLFPTIQNTHRLAYSLPYKHSTSFEPTRYILSDFPVETTISARESDSDLVYSRIITREMKADYIAHSFGQAHHYDYKRLGLSGLSFITLLRYPQQS
jgi:hypothetical protein